MTHVPAVRLADGEVADRLRSRLLAAGRRLADGSDSFDQYVER
jgi:hypothetical protein